MEIDVIINRGTINITSPTEYKTGTTGLLLAGDRKILFTDFGYDDYEDTDYDLTVQVFDAAGVPSGFTKGALETDGFNLTLSYDSYVNFSSNKR